MLDHSTGKLEAHVACWINDVSLPTADRRHEHKRAKSHGPRSGVRGLGHPAGADPHDSVCRHAHPLDCGA